MYETASRLHEPILGYVSYILYLEQQVQELKEQVLQLKTQSSKESLKQYIDHDLHPGVNYTIDDPDLSKDIHQAPISLMDLITRTPCNNPYYN